jgi:hypothetical protein
MVFIEMIDAAQPWHGPISLLFSLIALLARQERLGSLMYCIPLISIWGNE